MGHDTAEKSAAYQRKYRAEHPEQVRRLDRERNKRDNEKRTAYKRQYYQEHKADIAARNKAYYEAHKEERSVSNRRYREANVGRIMLIAAKERTRKQGLPECDLTVGYIESIIPECCPILGIKLEIGKGTAQPYSPSLDRIEPYLGYVQGNVQVISNRANMMKTDASWDELRAFAEWVLSYEYS